MLKKHMPNRYQGQTNAIITPPAPPSGVSSAILLNVRRSERLRSGCNHPRLRVMRRAIFPYRCRALLSRHVHASTHVGRTTNLVVRSQDTAKTDGNA